MKRGIIISLAVVMLSNPLILAQNIQLNIGKETRIFTEHTFANDNTMLYGYLEAVYKGGAYGQFILEQKFWQTPVFMHAEYRTYFGGGDTFLGGGAYSFYGKNGFISLSALYRYDGQHSPQVSVLYNYDWGRIDLYGYADFWGASSFNAYSETRLYVKLIKNISIGAIADLAYFGQFSITPYFGLRYKF